MPSPKCPSYSSSRCRQQSVWSEMKESRKSTVDHLAAPMLTKSHLRAIQFWEETHPN